MSRQIINGTIVTSTFEFIPPSTRLVIKKLYGLPLIVQVGDEGKWTDYYTEAGGC
jgi:hypothetical protein